MIPDEAANNAFDRLLDFIQCRKKGTPWEKDPHAHEVMVNQSKPATAQVSSQQGPEFGTQVAMPSKRSGTRQAFGPHPELPQASCTTVQTVPKRKGVQALVTKRHFVPTSGK